MKSWLACLERAASLTADSRSIHAANFHGIPAAGPVPAAASIPAVLELQLAVQHPAITRLAQAGSKTNCSVRELG